MILYLLNGYIGILIAAAVIPAIFIVRTVYKADHMEKEPRELIIKLLIGGVISTIAASILEQIGLTIMDNIEFESLAKYYLVEFFVLVGPAEEICKYAVLRKLTWKHPAFNCQFDAIVYSVSASLGFALWENIKYVFSYGMGTALLRAVTAVPGHACFGVFMGVWYGVAKRQEVLGNKDAALLFRIISVLMPALIHGAYDYIATASSGAGTLIFIVFIAIMFFVCYKVVKRLSKNDRYLDPNQIQL